MDLLRSMSRGLIGSHFTCFVCVELALLLEALLNKLLFIAKPVNLILSVGDFEVFEVHFANQPLIDQIVSPALSKDLLRSPAVRPALNDAFAMQNRKSSP